jgi:hypothetical protein
MVYFQFPNTTICGKKRLLFEAFIHFGHHATAVPCRHDSWPCLGPNAGDRLRHGQRPEESRVALSSKLNPMPTKSPVALEPQPLRHVQVNMQAQNCGKRWLCLAIHLVGERDAALSHSPTAVRHKVISYDCPKVDSICHGL